MSILKNIVIGILIVCAMVTVAAGSFFLVYPILGRAVIFIPLGLMLLFACWMIGALIRDEL